MADTAIMASESQPARKPINRRTGRAKGYRGQKGGAHQVAWRDDPVVMGRLAAGIQPWMERRSVADCLAAVNRWLAAHHPDEPPIAQTTLYEDRQRALKLRKEHAVDAVGEHIAELDHVQREAWQAFRDAADASLNRSAYLNTIAATIERKAKLDGSLKPDGGTTVQVNVAVIQQQQAEINAELLKLLMPYPELRVKAAAILAKYDEPERLETIG